MSPGWYSEKALTWGKRLSLGSLNNTYFSIGFLITKERFSFANSVSDSASMLAIVATLLKFLS